MTISMADQEYRVQGAIVLGRDRRDLYFIERAFRDVGWRIVMETSSESLRERLTSQPPAVVLLERQLAEGPGLEVCRAIRDQSPAITVLMIVHSPEEGALARNAGADDFIIMPMDFDEMVTRTEARVIVRRSRFVDEIAPSAAGISAARAEASLT